MAKFAPRYTKGFVRQFISKVRKIIDFTDFIASRQISFFRRTIMQGNTAENLMLFADEVQGLRSEAQEIAEQVRRAVENYVTSMDEADSYVY